MYTQFITTSDRERAATWHLVFAFNLLVPCFLGFVKTEGMARLGMLIGIVLFWLIGWAIAIRSKLLGTALNWGAIFVALSQMFLIGHFFFGMSAFLISWQLDTDLSSELNSFLSGLTATCIMGTCLMLTCLTIGFAEITLSGFFYNTGIRIMHEYVKEQSRDSPQNEPSASDE